MSQFRAPGRAQLGAVWLALIASCAAILFAPRVEGVVLGPRAARAHGTAPPTAQGGGVDYVALAGELALIWLAAGAGC